MDFIDNFVRDLGCSDFGKKLYKELNLGTRDDGMDILMAPTILLPSLGKMMLGAGILSKKKHIRVMAAFCAAFPVAVKVAMDSTEEPSDQEPEIFIVPDDDDDL